MVIGEIEHIFLNENLIESDGNVNHQKAQTITVSGLDSYFNVSPIARLSYAKINQATAILAEK